MLSSSAPPLDQVKAFVEHIAGLLVAQDYAAACALFTDTAAQAFSPDRLAREWSALVGPSGLVGLMPELTSVDPMEDWADRRPRDQGWGYVPVVGEEINEAVSGIVEATPQGLRLRTLELGRP